MWGRCIHQPLVRLGYGYSRRFRSDVTHHRTPSPLTLHCFQLLSGACCSFGCLLRAAAPDGQWLLVSGLILVPPWEGPPAAASPRCAGAGCFQLVDYCLQLRRFLAPRRTALCCYFWVLGSCVDAPSVEPLLCDPDICFNVQQCTCWPLSATLLWTNSSGAEASLTCNPAWQCCCCRRGLGMTSDLPRFRLHMCFCAVFCFIGLALLCLERKSIATPAAAAVMSASAELRQQVVPFSAL